MTAATIQQGFVSAIVELLIASGLALPKLLRSRRAAEGGLKRLRAAGRRRVTPRAACHEIGSFDVI
jgi:hypothetical protein